jgi:outer membrane protein assembly factor BamA
MSRAEITLLVVKALFRWGANATGFARPFAVGLTAAFVICSGDLGSALYAQAEAVEGSRAAEIIAARKEKAAKTAPEINSGVERSMLFVRENKILERFSAGIGGLRIKIGNLATGSGFALGPEYLRHNQSGRYQFRVAAQGSTKLFQKYDTEFDITRFGHDRFFLNFYAVHHNYPQLEYYGPGPDSLKSGRSNFRLEDTATDLNVGVRLLPHLSLVGSAGYLWNNVGPGTSDHLISTEQQFDPSQASGIDHQADFFRYGGFLQFDYRDRPGGPRRGGNYFVQFSRFEDQTLGRHDFNRLDIELQQYLPLFNERRVIALRAKTTMSETRDGQSVPFYMQPVLGGSESLRGYRPYRFYDNNLLLLNVEYRYEIFSGLDMAIFADAGKVVPRRGLINFNDLESDVGFGMRFNVRDNVFMRFDVGFSQEGFQVWLKFNKIFTSFPSRTSSSQGDF